MENKTSYFCAHIRAAMACYVDMTPEQQARAEMYAIRKIGALRTLHTAARAPGGALAEELLQRMKNPASLADVAVDER